jgi:hypothetical protein
MDEPKKLPPDKVAALAERLQGSLKRRRPRAWLFVVTAVVVALGVLGLLTWWLTDSSEPVRLEIVAFDLVVAPADVPRVAAQLAFPEKGEYSPSLLRGRDVVFLDARSVLLPGQQGTQERTTSDADGRASVAWPRPAGAQVERIVVRYIDARHKQGSTDQANLVPWDGGGKILLVDAEETLAQLAPARWEATHPAEIKPQNGAAVALQDAELKKHRIAYLTTTSNSPLAYRKVRGWVHAPRAVKERFPAGPVLGRLNYAKDTDVDQARSAMLEDLKARFGEPMTLVANRAPAADAARRLGIAVVTIAAPAPIQGAVNLRNWGELPAHLAP